MTKNNSLKNNIQLLSKIEKKVFEKMSNELIKIKWDTESPYFDKNWGWLILAGKTLPEYGYVIKRIKPFPLYSVADFSKAIKFQERVRKDLVEVTPCKVFLGNKISIPELNDSLTFLTEADFPLWTKFFRNKNFRLKSDSIDEAKILEDDQLVKGNFSEAINGSES